MYIFYTGYVPGVFLCPDLILTAWRCMLSMCIYFNNIG